MLQNIKARKTGLRMHTEIQKRPLATQHLACPILVFLPLSGPKVLRTFKTCYGGMLDRTWDLLSVEDLEGFS